MSTGAIVRRAFLVRGLMLLGFGRAPMRGSRAWGPRQVWAQLIAATKQADTAVALATDAPRFSPLARAVRIPLEDVKIPWLPATFTAEAMAPATATAVSRRVLISGVLFRRGSRDIAREAAGQAERGGRRAGSPGSTGELSALCLTCPHEQCKVDLVTDPDQLAGITGRTATHPLFECACHSSIFDAMNDGARIAGETPRGLYRFRITGVSDGTVEISEVESDALAEV